MKLRSFAALLAVTLLSACSGDTILPARELAGPWLSNRETVAAVFPEGPRSLQGQVVLSFMEDGTFTRQTSLYDPQGDRHVTDAVEQGTYTARSGVARLTITQQYQRGAGAPVEHPVPVPAGPYTLDYRYTITGGEMMFVSVCPANALCVEPRFTHYSSLLVAD